jgi:hypothetical protein
MADDADPADATDAVKKWAALVVASVLLLVYLVLVAVAWGKTGEAADAWARRLALLGGIEALAFGGAGWLFGKEVSRQTIEQAKGRTADAEKQRDKANAEGTEAKANAVAAAQALKMLGPPLEQAQTMSAAAAQQPRDLAAAILTRYGVAG